jgi:hypothetical protein
MDIDLDKIPMDIDMDEIPTDLDMENMPVEMEIDIDDDFEDDMNENEMDEF